MDSRTQASHSLSDSLAKSRSSCSSQDFLLSLLYFTKTREVSNRSQWGKGDMVGWWEAGEDEDLGERKEVTDAGKDLYKQTIIQTPSFQLAIPNGCHRLRMLFRKKSAAPFILITQFHSSLVFKSWDYWESVRREANSLAWNPHHIIAPFPIVMVILPHSSNESSSSWNERCKINTMNQVQWIDKHRRIMI